MNDLTDLMRRTADGPTSDDLDVAAVLATGRRRLRTRRRRIAGGIATLAAAAVVGVAVLAGGTGGGPDAAGQRRTAPPVAGPVVSFDDARPAVPGRDYDLLLTHEVPDLDAEPVDAVSGVSEDGKLVTVESNTSPPNRVALIDPGSGERDPLPLTAASTRAFELGTDRLVLPTLLVGEKPVAGAQVLDRASGTWSEVSWPTLPGIGARYVTPVGIGPDDRVYLQVMREFEPTAPELWSASLTDPADVRDEGLPAGDASVVGDVLAWIDSDEAPTGALHLRDLATGRQTDLEVPGAAACATELQHRGDLVALTQDCGTRDGVADRRVVLLDASGEILATFLAAELRVVQITGDAVAIAVVDGRRARGTYVYDTGEEELLRLSDERPGVGLPGPVPDGLLLWTTSIRGAGYENYGSTYRLAAWPN